MWIDPTNANRMTVGHDGGISISVNRGRTWNIVQLPNAQIYHVTVDSKVPYFVYGNMQDGPSSRGPSNSRAGVAVHGRGVSQDGGFRGAGYLPTDRPRVRRSDAGGDGRAGAPWPH
jgi:hypothetical protein